MKPAAAALKPAFGRSAAMRAAVLLTGSTYVSYALGLLVSALIARHIGPVDFGRYSYLVWLSGLLVMIANNGLTTTAIRFIAEQSGRRLDAEASSIHGWLRRRQFRDIALTLAAFMVIAVLAPPAGWQGQVPTLLAVVALSAAPKAMYLFDISAAKGYGQFTIEARTTVCISVFVTVGVLLLIAFDASLKGFLALFVASGLGHWWLASLWLSKAGLATGRQPPQGNLRGRIAAHLWWTIVLAVVAALGNRSVETYLLNASVGPAEVGYFAIAVALTRGGVDLVSAGLNAVLMPAMGHAYGAGGLERVRGLVARSLRYFTFLGLMLAGSGAWGACAVIGLLYGDRYAAAVDVMRVLMLVAGLSLPMGVLGSLLSTTDHQRLRATVSVLSLIIGATAAFALVPRFGLPGAVASSAAASLFVFVAVLILCARMMAIRLPLRELSRLYLAAGLAAAGTALIAAWWQPGAWSQFAIGAGFAVVLVGLSIILGAWNVEDIAGLRHLLAETSRAPARLVRLVERWEVHATTLARRSAARRFDQRKA